MKAIARELRRRSKKVKEVQRQTNIYRMIGAASAGLGIAGVVAAAFFASERAAVMALGCAAVIGGGSFVVGETERVLSETKQLEMLLDQTAALADRSRQVVDVAVYMERGVGEMLNIVTRITSTPDEDAALRECIADSAERCEKTLTELANLRKVLRTLKKCNQNRKM